MLPLRPLSFCLALLLTAALYAEKKPPAGSAAPAVEAYPTAISTENATAATTTKGVSLALYGGLPYGQDIAQKQQIRLLGVNLGFGYSNFLRQRVLQPLGVYASLDLQRFLAQNIPANALGTTAGISYALYTKGAWYAAALLGGGYLMGKVDSKDSFYFPTAEVVPTLRYAFHPRWALEGRLRQQFYFDPKGLFLATALQIGGVYAF